MEDKNDIEISDDGKTLVGNFVTSERIASAEEIEHNMDNQAMSLANKRRTDEAVHYFENKNNNRDVGEYTVKVNGMNSGKVRYPKNSNNLKEIAQKFMSGLKKSIKFGNREDDRMIQKLEKSSAVFFEKIGEKTANIKVLVAGTLATAVIFAGSAAIVVNTAKAMSTDSSPAGIEYARYQYEDMDNYIYYCLGELEQKILDNNFENISNVKILVEDINSFLKHPDKTSIEYDRMMDVLSHSELLSTTYQDYAARVMAERTQSNSI